MAQKIMAARDVRGVYKSVNELSEAGVPEGIIARLREIQAAMDQLGGYRRK